MIRQVAVVVPAADEEERIGGCLTALTRAVDHLRAAYGDAVTTELIVVLDQCHDRTEEIVASFPDVRPVTVSGRCVGAARAAGACAALRPDSAPDRTWIANTDADTQVPAGWLTYQVRAADAGVDLVLGTVRPGAELPRRVHAAWLRAHRLAEGHPHVHGANLGLRASLLCQLGGWRPLVTGEDVDLVDRAVAAHAAILRTGAVPADTSARTEGRAPAGFSSYLRGLTAQPTLVRRP